MRRASVNIKGCKFACSVASTADEWTVGLQKTSSLAADEGMLFDFGRTRLVSFWMGKVAFPIDIIGVSANSRVVKIEENATPGRDDTYSFPPVFWVLEVPGGTCHRAGFVVGDEVDIRDARVAGTDWIDDALTLTLEPIRTEDGWIEQEPNKSRIARALDWAAKNPAKETDLDALVRKAQIVDEGKFVEKVSALLVGKVEEMVWSPDILNGGATERCIVTRAELSRWLSQDIPPEELSMLLANASTDRGLSLVGDAFLLAGLADIARVGYSQKKPILILYRTAEKG